MIVRNEEAIIVRCLASVAPFISSWSILDTGSVDQTPAVIEGFFAQRGIPGHLHHSKFVDFSSSRNRALELCRAQEQTFDYILLIDADMELVADKANWTLDLHEPVYAIRQFGALVYENIRLLRRDIDASYRGVTHEYLNTEFPSCRLDTMHMLDHACGSNRDNKFQRDIQLLEDGLAKEPENVRYMFYLAQSLKDAGEVKEAISWYRKRIEAGGWDEECWYARYQLADCLLQSDMASEGVATALQAWDERPWRSEPLAILSAYYRKIGSHNLCCKIAEMGQQVEFPEPDRLFVEIDVYQWRFRQELAISGYYAHDPTLRQLGAQCCNDLATDVNVPDEVRRLARSNLRFYACDALEAYGLEIVATFVAPSVAGWNSFNPSICLEDGLRAIVIRQANYRMEERCYITDDPNDIIRSNNFMVLLDGDLQPQDIKQITLAEPADRRVTVPRFPFPVRGYEDYRLFRWKGRWWASATVRDTTATGMCEMSLLELNEDAQIVQEIMLRGDFSDRHQKNWMPFVKSEQLYFVYSLDPLIILKFNESKKAVEIAATHRPALSLDHLRGGGQLLPFQQGYLGICHEVAAQGNEPGQYLHRIFTLDRDFRLTAISNVFSFTGAEVEFCAGMALEDDGQSLLFSFGVNDAEALLGRVSLAKIIDGLIAVDEMTLRQA